MGHEGDHHVSGDFFMPPIPCGCGRAGYHVCTCRCDYCIKANEGQPNPARCVGDDQRAEIIRLLKILVRCEGISP